MGPQLTSSCPWTKELEHKVFIANVNNRDMSEGNSEDNLHQHDSCVLALMCEHGILLQLQCGKNSGLS